MTWLRQPRHLLLVAFVLACVAGITLATLAMVNSGTGWDSTVEVEISRNVLGGLPGTLEAAYDVTPFLFEFYGTLNYAIVDALAGALTPNFWLDPTNHATYVWLGAWNILIGVLGLGALAYAVARAFRSALAGWLLAALTLSTPLWVGHLSMNYKDIPTAVGLSIMTAGLVLAWLRSPRRADLVTSTVFVAVGTAQLVGSRTSGLVLVGILVIGAWVTSLFRRSVVATSFFGVLLGLGLVWLQSPFARLGMVRWLADAVTTSNIEPSELRFAGQDISSGALPITYIPGWFLAQLPVLTTLLLIAGTVLIVVSLIGRLEVLPRRELYPLTPIALQAFVLPGAIAVSKVIIYDAARHVLFALPALLVLGVVPLVWAQRSASSPLRLRGAVAISTAVVVLAGLFACVRWHPYEYAFVNPIAGIRHDHRDWELDYWGLSVREGIQRLNDMGIERVAVLPSDDPGEAFGALLLDDVRNDHGPYGVYVFKRYDAALPDNCDRVFTIIRDGQTLGEGGICQPTR